MLTKVLLHYSWLHLIVMVEEINQNNYIFILRHCQIAQWVPSSSYSVLERRSLFATAKNFFTWHVCFVTFQGITFDEFRSFFQFLNNLEDFAIAMQMYNFASRSIGQGESRSDSLWSYLRTSNTICKYKVTESLSRCF